MRLDQAGAVAAAPGLMRAGPKAADGQSAELVRLSTEATIELVELPFGTIKASTGASHLLMKRLPNVKTEVSLHVLAYNIKRMIQIGTGALVGAIRS